MKKLINLNSTEWCDIVFEGKNKAYGAYKLRQTAGKRYVYAFGIMCIFVALIAAIPSIAGKINANNDRIAGIENPYELITVVEKPPLNDIEEIKPKMQEVPTEKFLNMDKFTQINIVEDDKMKEENEINAMSDMTNSKKAIGIFVVENGSDDADAVRKEMANRDAIMGQEKKDGANAPVRWAEIMPVFPGGEKEMYQYIFNNLKYPVPDIEVGTQGKVIIQFVVGRDGSIINATIVRGISIGCDKEALRVVKSMPKWIPGRQNGIPVQVYFTLPIVFKLN